MPNWLRRYTFYELKKYYEEKNQAEEDAKTAAENQSKANKTPSVVTPPDFVSKRSA